ncbi:MAG: PIN domain-containing protein, partial [Nanoarchaeota archaeon]
LVEIANGNPKFTGYINSDFVITDLTLAEFYAVLLREEGEQVADYWFKKLERYAKSLDKETLIEAIKFRYAHRKTNISFFDAAGYVFSVKNGYYFVTGDKEFEKFDFVEFKKK